MKGFTIIELMILVAILAIVAAIAFPAWACHKDPSSCPAREDSIPGFEVVTDYATGCQYFKKDTGYAKMLTPRMGADGKQICNSLSVERPQ